MDFTREQKVYLLKILTPSCCHTTGMHSPTHFEDDPAEFCESQKAQAWQNAVSVLNLRPAKADSRPTCSWCDSARKQAESEKNLNYPSLSAKIIDCLSGELDTFNGKVIFEHQQFHLEFKKIHRVADIGACSWFCINPPKFAVAEPVLSGEYPKKRGNLSDGEKERIINLFQCCGAKVLSTWAHLSIAIEQVCPPLITSGGE